MGFVILLIIIFIITVVIMVMNPPDKMGEEESCKAKVKDLWGIVNICHTASYGSPMLKLRPARRSVLMGIDFLNADTVSLSLPLLLKKQQKAKDRYLKLFSDNNLKVAELDNEIIVRINRKDEGLGELIAQLYKDIFEASDTDTVKIAIRTLKSDIKLWQHFEDRHLEFNSDAKFIAPSARHKGKSVLRVLSERIFGAVYFLLYPPLIVLSYKFGDLTGMCWSALIFFGFFSIYNPVYKKRSIAGSIINGSLLYCILISATLWTQNVTFLQSIPTVMGVSTAVMTAALVIGIRQPKSERDIYQKRERRREFNFINSFIAISGVVLFLISEWARRNLEFDAWISFFAFVRIELMMVMLIIFAPAMAIFLHTEKKQA